MEDRGLDTPPVKGGEVFSERLIMSMPDEMEDVQQTFAGCPQCAAVNSPQAKFCSRCGTSLWEPCLQCGELCPTGGNYCGACGVNLADAAAGQLERIDADFRTAFELQSVCRFDEAIAMLHPITKNTHPRMSERAFRAAHFIRQIVAQRNKRRATVEADYQRARQCFDAFDYDGAVHLLEDIPQPLQTPEIEKLRAEVAARREQIAACVDDLNRMVRAKRLAELPAGIERLLALQPDHAYARKLAEQLQKRLVMAAESQLAKHRYAESLALLEQIDPRVRSLSAQALHRQVSELASLMADLRDAPVIDKTLVAVAERLCKLAPGDAKASRLRTELQQRIHAAGTEPRLVPLAWAAPPQQTTVGPSIDWSAGLHRMVPAETLDASLLRAHPGRFGIACGLALAGLRQEAVHINFRPTYQPSMLHQVKRLMQSDISATKKAWGIDLGVSGLKAVKLSWHEPKRAVIEAAVMIEHPKPLNHAANDVEHAGIVADSLRAFIESQQPKNDRICVGLPGRMALARYLELPPVKGSKAEKLIRFEAPNLFPMALEHMDWDFHVFDNRVAAEREKNAAANDQKSHAFVVGAQRRMIDRFVEPFRLLGLNINLLQPDFVALHNFVVYEYLDAASDGASSGQNAIAAIDMGSDVTNIVISSPQSLWFHGCGVAGQNFTRALVTSFKLSFAQAEQLKRAPESAERFSDVEASLSPVIDDLAKEMRHLLDVHAKKRPDQPVERIVGLGGGFSLHGLLRHLRVS